MRCAHRRVVGEAHELLDQLLAAVVGGVRLAGDDDLDRPLGVQQQRGEPLGVAQHQGEPLVRRHPAGEADGEHVGVEHLVDPAELGLAGAALQPGACAPAARTSATSRARSSRRTAQMSVVGDAGRRPPSAAASVAARRMIVRRRPGRGPPAPPRSARARRW